MKCWGCIDRIRCRMSAEIRCGGLLFTSKFDSGNLASVEKVEKSDSDSDTAPADPYGCRIIPDYEFNVWTKPDCGGTQYENGNRSWFYFGIRGNSPNKVIKLNIVNLNRQGKLYSQGMAPMVKVLPSKPKWDRIRDRATYQMSDGQFTLSFTYRFSEQKGGTTYFAFCFPWSYTESQEQMEKLDEAFPGCADLRPGQVPDSKIYYHREVASYSIDKRKIDVLTITSCKGMCAEREPRLENLFPDKAVPRPHRFKGKRVYYVSSRVHPGETPASFVFNGFLEFALRENDARAQALRDRYIIKLIPMLNPDGVYRGHYRTDQRGVNLNRLYLVPDVHDHPSIYASRSLLLFYHHYYRIKEQSDPKIIEQNGHGDADEKSLQVQRNGHSSDENSESKCHKSKESNGNVLHFGKSKKDSVKEPKFVPFQGDYTSIPSRESGLAFYVDLHGHASKRGCFIYGNHLDNEEDQVDNLLFPKLIALNSAHFDFNGCNFTERNMYLKDKRDGMSKEGSGRVAIFKTTGIIHSYTLECNYNTGRTVNCIAAANAPTGKTTPPPAAGFPPKYTPEILEGVGRAMAIAGLDFYGCNPWSRLKHSEFTSLDNLRNWMTRYVRSSRGAPILPRKMTTRIPITNSNATNGSSNSSANGNSKNGGNRFSGGNNSSGSRNGPVTMLRNGGSNGNSSANSSNGTRVVATTRNNLAPFKSMSTSSVGNLQGRFSNRQKSLIRVTVNNNNGRAAKNTPEQPTKRHQQPLQPCQKGKSTQETPVTLSFTTINANAKNLVSPSTPNGTPTAPNPTGLPGIIESFGGEMDERLMLYLRALESPSFPHSLDGGLDHYASSTFNSAALHNSHYLRALTPPHHYHSVPPHIRNTMIMQNLTQEYSLSSLELPTTDTKGVNFLTKQQASFLLNKGAPFTGHGPKQKPQSLQYPRFRESGFISPQVCKPPSLISRGKSALSLDAPVSHNHKVASTSADQKNHGYVSTATAHSTITPQPVVLSINGMEKHLPLTVTRKPLLQAKDETNGFALKSAAEIYNPTTRPPIVNFSPNAGLLPQSMISKEPRKAATPSNNRRISKLPRPRKISSGRDITRRSSGSKLAIEKEIRYLKTPKTGQYSRQNGGISEPILSGEAVQLTPRAPKSMNEEAFKVVRTPAPGSIASPTQNSANTSSPTAINASLMMMNCSPVVKDADDF